MVICCINIYTAITELGHINGNTLHLHSYTTIPEMHEWNCVTLLELHYVNGIILH